MPDIFVNYSREDVASVTQLVKVMASTGWDVWWDRNISAGSAFRQVIEKAIDESRCILVVWTPASARSHWVLDEAEVGRKGNILVPVILEEVEIPLGFRSIQTLDLVRWNGDEYDKTIAELFTTLELRIGRPKANDIRFADSSQE